MSSLPYLGIQIPLDLNQMITMNFSSLLAKISNDFKCWNAMILNWNDQMQVVKMMVLPRFLYFFVLSLWLFLIRFF